MSDVAVRAAHSGFFMGVNKCKTHSQCGCGHTEDVVHAFRDCNRVKKLWKRVLSAWTRASGEVRMRESDSRVTILGDRSGLWLDDADAAAGRANSEAWAVVHKATMHVIWNERNRARAAARGEGGHSRHVRVCPRYRPATRRG